MARRSKPKAKKPIEQYEHKDKKRVNNPPVGLVDASTDATEKTKPYEYDPHLDPTLQWAGKAERTSFEIPTVSLHVHERIDPRTILEAVRKQNGSSFEQTSLFSSPAENPPLREAIEFYKHAHNWSNRLIAGDSLLVMNSLLEKEGMAGHVQMIYFDPPYGITYGSNFQPFVNKRSITEGKDEDLTAEPETVKAFRDTWELGIHSYLAFLRDRLFLARELMGESGSLFLQISDENVHHGRELLDEIFGPENYVSSIVLKKKGGQKSGMVDPINDYILWTTKHKQSARTRFQKLFVPIRDDELANVFRYVELADGRCVTVTQLSNETGTDYRNQPGRIANDFPGARLFASENLTSGGFRRTQSIIYKYNGEAYDPGIARGNCWKHSAITDDGSPSGLDRLAAANRLFVAERQLRYKRYASDFGYSPITNLWDEFAGVSNPIFVVQTTDKAIQRCMLMVTTPGDLVLDITCGSGTTAYVAEQWGRRWMTCDSSRVALTLAKQRLMTAVYDYYMLAHEHEGVGSGFSYEEVEHITSSTIATVEEPERETLVDRPLADPSKARVAGPFTVEAVPAPMVVEPGFIESHASKPSLQGGSAARAGETRRQEEWRAELLRSGIRGKRGQMIEFSRVEPLPGTRWLQADAETKPNQKGAGVIREGGAATQTQRVVVSFGPEHAPLEQRQVEAAIEEARKLVPRPEIVVFAAFQFDPEAAKDIDELNWPGVTVLKAQMNADLLTEDLKKKRSSNESFWLIGQPEIVLRKARGEGKKAPEPLWEVEVKGFDYYNTRTGQIESGGPKQIAVWMLDTDYDGRSLFPRQVFFPMAGEKEGWSKLAKNLKAEIDEDRIEAYRGTISLPFETGEHRRVAVKIVDDRGIESLKILDLP